MFTRRLAWLSVLLVAAATVLAACGGGAPAASAPTSAPAAASSPVDITLKEFSFTPNSITAKAGQPITVNAKNAGTLEHDWSVLKLEATNITKTSDDGFNGEGSPQHKSLMTPGMELPPVHLALTPGHSGSITFTPTTPGTYQFECTVNGHADAGMKGTLVVQ